MFSAGTLLLALIATPLAAAWPLAPGSCLSPNPLGSSHILGGAGFDGGTALSDFDLSVKIGDSVLDPATPFEVTAGTDYPISLVSGDSGAFLGFLMRLAKTSVDATDYFTTEDANVQIFTMCHGAGAAGLAHNNNTEKTMVMGTLNVDMAVEGLVLDVTTVISNGKAVPGSPSEWYLSNYTINAIAAPTAAPVEAPPSTPAPSSAYGVTTTSTVSMVLLAVIGTGVSILM